MSTYIGTQITDAIATLLSTITKDSGKRTDIGLQIDIDKAHVDAHEYCGIVIMEGSERFLGREAGLLTTEIEYTIDAKVNSRLASSEGHASSPKSVHAILGDIVADIRETLESEWCPLSSLGASLKYDGLTRHLVADAGELIGVEMRYLVIFAAKDGDFSSIP